MKTIKYELKDESFGKVATITFDEPDSPSTPCACSGRTT